MSTRNKSKNKSTARNKAATNKSAANKAVESKTATNTTVEDKAAENNDLKAESAARKDSEISKEDQEEKIEGSCPFCGEEACDKPYGEVQSANGGESTNQAKDSSLSEAKGCEPSGCGCDTSKNDALDGENIEDMGMGTHVYTPSAATDMAALRLAKTKKLEDKADLDVKVAIGNVDYSIMGDDIVKNFNLVLRKGEVVCLYGPSGCGKTTILRLVSYLISPDTGHVRMFADRMSYLFQEHRLLPWRTLQENIELVSKQSKDDAFHKKMERILGNLYLEKHDWDKYPNELSGGMRQRVSLARALINDPDLILMDEPFSALDYELKLHLYELMLKRVESGLAIIMVTHDRFEALRLADKIILLEKKPARCRRIMNLSRPKHERDDKFIEHHLRLPVWQSYAE